MNFIKGVGKAGTGIFGSVVQEAGKVVETVGDVAGSAPIVGGVVGSVVGGTGQVIEKAGQATENLGDALFGDKKKPEEVKTDGDPVDEEAEDEEAETYQPYFYGFNDVYVWPDGDDVKEYYDDTLEDLIAYDQVQAQLQGEA